MKVEKEHIWLLYPFHNLEPIGLSVGLSSIMDQVEFFIGPSHCYKYLKILLSGFFSTSFNTASLLSPFSLILCINNGMVNMDQTCDLPCHHCWSFSTTFTSLILPISLIFEFSESIQSIEEENGMELNFKLMEIGSCNLEPKKLCWGPIILVWGVTYRNNSNFRKKKDEERLLIFLSKFLNKLKKPCSSSIKTNQIQCKLGLFPILFMLKPSTQNLKAWLRLLFT